MGFGEMLEIEAVVLVDQRPIHNREDANNCFAEAFYSIATLKRIDNKLFWKIDMNNQEYSVGDYITVAEKAHKAKELHNLEFIYIKRESTEHFFRGCYIKCTQEHLDIVLKRKNLGEQHAS